MNPKELAAKRAVVAVQNGMIVGLGTGSTATYAIRFLGERIRQESLNIRGVPTSQRSQELAREVGIPLMDLSEAETIDLTIDGADEVDPTLNLIKGAGGALVREKLVACASRELCIICDESKIRPALGAVPLPVAVIPFGWKATYRRLLPFGGTIRMRTDASDAPYRTDDGLYILDMRLEAIRDPAALERSLKLIPGVVETGLFIGLARRVIIGCEDGHIEERASSPHPQLTAME